MRFSIIKNLITFIAQYCPYLYDKFLHLVKWQVCFYWIDYKGVDRDFEEILGLGSSDTCKEVLGVIANEPTIAVGTAVFALVVGLVSFGVYLYTTHPDIAYLISDCYSQIEVYSQIFDVYPFLLQNELSYEDLYMLSKKLHSPNLTKEMFLEIRENWGVTKKDQISLENPLKGVKKIK